MGERLPACETDSSDGVQENAPLKSLAKLHNGGVWTMVYLLNFHTI